MKVLFTGSRSVKDPAIFDSCMEQLLTIKDDHRGKRFLINGERVTTVIQGGAIGVDTLAKEWARKNGIATITIRPDYEKYGPRYAPIQRNAVMVDMLDAGDITIAIYDGKSKGTKYTINMTKRKRRKVIEFGWVLKEGWTIIDRTPMVLEQYKLDI